MNGIKIYKDNAFVTLKVTKPTQSVNVHSNKLIPSPNYSAMHI